MDYHKQYKQLAAYEFEKEKSARRIKATLNCLKANRIDYTLTIDPNIVSIVVVEKTILLDLDSSKGKGSQTMYSYRIQGDNTLYKHKKNVLLSRIKEKQKKHPNPPPSKVKKAPASHTGGTPVESDGWVDIQGYEGRYQVHHEGMVRSLNYQRSGKTQELRPGFTSYPFQVNFVKVRLSKDGISKSFDLQQLVGRAFLGVEGNRTHAIHRNLDFRDNSVANLRMVSREEYYRTITGYEKELMKERERSKLAKTDPGTELTVDPVKHFPADLAADNNDIGGMANKYNTPSMYVTR